MYYYGARWYDASLARFIAADSLVPNPGNAQALNRYSYTLNNPIRYTDPTGQRVVEDSSAVQGCHTGASIYNCLYPAGHQHAGWLIGSAVPSAASISLPMGVSGTIPGFSFSVSGAIEVVADNDALTYTAFLKYERGFQIGMNETGLSRSVGHDLYSLNVVPGLPVFANIYNVDDIPADYAGPFRSLTGSAAFGPGIRWGEDAHPLEIAVSSSDRRQTYSKFVGPVYGKALSVSQSAGYNIPVLTVNLEHPAESRLYNPFVHITRMFSYFGDVVPLVQRP